MENNTLQQLKNLTLSQQPRPLERGLQKPS